MIRFILFSAARLVAVFFLLWLVFSMIGKVLEFATSWDITTVAIIGTLAAEAIYQLYRYERGVVTAKRGRWLLTLRLIALLGLLWMLLQPVWSRLVEREILREVVVLIDDSASMHLKDDDESLTRSELGQRALEKSGLHEKLEGKINVRTLRAARKTLNPGDATAEGWDQATDLAEALSTVLEQVPADNLGGVVLISDGRHNRPSRVEDVARRFGILDAPIGILPTGSDKPPRDAAILSVNTPDAVYLGDRIRVSARLKFDGFRGEKTKVRLLRGDDLLEERTITIPQDRHREEVKFRHTPEKGGVGAYRIEMSALKGEKFSNNNSWEFETAVTDARTNVLIIESHARWEFRYLRNLFYGRDKSIHLQYVLLNPDRITGQEQKTIAASAARPFGEARATTLPVSEEEWRKFDVIIMGDVSPESINGQQWKYIQGCVEQRGALFISIAGPRWMPHAYSNKTAQTLIPVEYPVSSRNYFSTSGKEFRMALTSEGRSHTITAQSDSRLENTQLWAKFPSLRWRHPITGVKPNAEVLLMAQETQGKQPTTPANAKSLDSALADLAARKQNEARNALLVTQQLGNGKIAALLTDRSWRLREGVGDTHHHRFWGQLVRWGAGPNLRSGSGGVRLGTDQLSYSGDDQIKITARLRDEKLTPVQDDTLRAHITVDGEKVATIPLTYVEDSNGLHQALAGPFPKLGNYQITLEGEKADNLSKNVATSARVIGATSPVELSETTLNLPLLETMAELSGGSVITADTLSSLPSLFLTGDETRQELRETTLWDHWILLLILFATLTLEWIMRRSGGLP